MSRLEEAVAAHRAGRQDEAERGYRETLIEEPDNLRAHFMLGVLAAQTDREELAVEHLATAADRDETNFEAAQWLTRALAFLGRHAAAETYARRAAALRPQDYGAALDLATAYFGQARYDKAASEFMRAVQLNPRRPEAYNGMATTYLRLGDPNQARIVLRDASRLMPGEATWLKLGEGALACDEPEEAILCANRILKTQPNHVDALILLSRANSMAQREAEVDDTLTRLERVAPEDPIALVLRGRRRQTQGQFQEAETDFRRSISVRPRQGVAYYGIVAGRRVTEDDRPLVDQMEDVLAQGGMKDDDTAHLHYALGKAYDNLGDYGAAMRNFDEGNRVMRLIRMGVRPYDREAARRQIDQIIGLFTKEFLAENSQTFAYAPMPVFIAGIMRSGTTLAEQILSCHPEIGGAGEQSFWRYAEYEGIDYAAGTANAEFIRSRAKEYVARLASIAPGRPYVTDKNPANRLVYGLIHIAYTDARIFHMRRNPLDVAISIYTTLIRTGASFFGDREDIVFALKEHARLSAHWHRVLREDRFMEVVYEDLVRDREVVTRRMVDFLGLEWKEACLRPEENLRTVTTPSLWQVRQPVYTGSVERWRRYERYLGPFAELLED